MQELLERQCPVYVERSANALGFLETVSHALEYSGLVVALDVDDAGRRCVESDLTYPPVQLGEGGVGGVPGPRRRWPPGAPRGEVQHVPQQHHHVGLDGLRGPHGEIPGAAVVHGDEGAVIAPQVAVLAVGDEQHGVHLGVGDALRLLPLPVGQLDGVEVPAREPLQADHGGAQLRGAPTGLLDTPGFDLVVDYPELGEVEAGGGGELLGGVYAVGGDLFGVRHRGARVGVHSAPFCHRSAYTTDRVANWSSKARTLPTSALMSSRRSPIRASKPSNCASRRPKRSLRLARAS